MGKVLLSRRVEYNEEKKILLRQVLHMYLHQIESVEFICDSHTFVDESFIPVRNINQKKIKESQNSDFKRRSSGRFVKIPSLPDTITLYFSNFLDVVPRGTREHREPSIFDESPFLQRISYTSNMYLKFRNFGQPRLED